MGLGSSVRSCKRLESFFMCADSYHLFCVQGSYENQQGIQLMRFADYFGRAFVTVSAAQFPWAKMFKESPVSKMVDVSYLFPRDSAIYACDAIAVFRIAICLHYRLLSCSRTY